MNLGKRTGVLALAAVLAAASGCSTRAPEGGGGSDTAAGEGEVTTDVGVEGTEITLGVLTDLTGVFSALGTDITNANTLFWEKQNAGDKVCGEYTVKLDIKDTGYVPQQGVQLYSGMKDNVLAMQQTIGSPINTALEATYEADQIINLPSAWARNLTKLEGNTVVGAVYDVEMYNGLQYALDAGLIKAGDKLGHIYFEGEYGANGLAGSKAFAANNDMTVVEQKIKPTDQDMSSQITSFKSQGVNAIVLTVAPGQTGSVGAVAAATGLDVPIIGSNPVFSPALLKSPAADQLKKRLIVSSPVNAFDTHPELLEEYLAKYPDAVPSLGVVFGTAMGEVMKQILDTAVRERRPDPRWAARGQEGAQRRRHGRARGAARPVGRRRQEPEPRELHPAAGRRPRRREAGCSRDRPGRGRSRPGVALRHRHRRPPPVREGAVVRPCQSWTSRRPTPRRRTRRRARAAAWTGCGSRSFAPRKPPASAVTAMTSTASHATGPNSRTHEGDGVDDQGRDVLQRVDALQRLGEEHAEHPQEQHAEPGAEVRPVDRGEQHRHQHHRGVGAAALAAPPLHLPREPRLRDEQGARQQDEERHDGLEDRPGRRQQQHRAGDAPEDTGDRQHPHGRGAAHELRPAPGHAAGVAGEQRDGVGHVGRHRRVAGGEQRREGDERAAARDRVDGSGQQPGAGEQADGRGRHRRTA
jgi:ABC-type branched-subunit amino acid transport system substrate-binding protein